ncbi:hypothetical protein AGLY_015388 [Aphis glycines]|uniref:Uncharacterized protein n=1 Tax=Aphis glycines TaxID=307491 RepID=A0A6G0T189_APHGL|nr:hypothetical protein AGLY_015388 [Aphis glycines]
MFHPENVSTVPSFIIKFWDSLDSFSKIGILISFIMFKFSLTFISTLLSNEYTLLLLGTNGTVDLFCSITSSCAVVSMAFGFSKLNVFGESCLIDLQNFSSVTEEVGTSPFISDLILLRSKSVPDILDSSDLSSNEGEMTSMMMNNRLYWKFLILFELSKAQSFLSDFSLATFGSIFIPSSILLSFCVSEFSLSAFGLILSPGGGIVKLKSNGGFRVTCSPTSTSSDLLL